MNRSVTQFAVAVISVFLVGAVVMMLTWGAVFRDIDPALAMASFAALTGITGAASAYLFRLNGAAK
jgi:hypothetical protein